MRSPSTTACGRPTGRICVPRNGRIMDRWFNWPVSYFQTLRIGASFSGTRQIACLSSHRKPMTGKCLDEVETSLSGYELLNDPLLNKGTAFTEAERDEFDLHGLLPPHVSQLDYQVQRRLDAFRALHSNLQKYTFLRGLQDSNEILFHALLTRNIEEMMPIVYTPTRSEERRGG